MSQREFPRWKPWATPVHFWSEKTSHNNYVDDLNRFNCSVLGGVRHNGYSNERLVQTPAAAIRSQAVATFIKFCKTNLRTH